MDADSWPSVSLAYWANSISHTDDSRTHISLLHQPLSLRCVQAVGLSQEPLLEGLPVDLNENGKITNGLTFVPSASQITLMMFFLFLPADPTACPADCAVSCGLLSPRCAPARPAPGCRRPCASALLCRPQCGFGRVPSPCPCSTCRR